jgi:hypothetical protein
MPSSAVVVGASGSGGHAWTPVATAIWSSIPLSAQKHAPVVFEQ